MTSAPEDDVPPDLILAVVALLAGVVLALLAVSGRTLAGLDLPDSATDPAQVLEHGRLTGARSAVLALWSVALVTVGIQGVVGAPRAALLTRAGWSSAAVLLVALVEGLWGTAAVSAAVVLAAFALRPRADRSRRPSRMTAPDGTFHP